MSAIDLLFRSAIDYERTHQIALFTLLKRPLFAERLLGITSTTKAPEWEPERQLFDLAVQDGTVRAFLELKMWSGLSDSQFNRQIQFLTATNCRGWYVLLGASWFERTPDRIEKDSKGTARRLGYDELITALNHVLVASGESPEVYELTLAYRNALQEQFESLKGAFRSPQASKIFFYSLYWQIQARLNGLATTISTVNNPGGEVYILQSVDSWTTFSFCGHNTDLYFELVNGHLCIKFHLDGPDRTKYAAQKMIRKAVRAFLESKYAVEDHGRLGTYMTACRLAHDFSNVEHLDESAEIFRVVASVFPKIAAGVSEGAADGTAQIDASV